MEIVYIDSPDVGYLDRPKVDDIDRQVEQKSAAMRKLLNRLIYRERAREHRRNRPFHGSTDIEPAKRMFATLEDYCSYVEAYRSKHEDP